MKMSKILKTSKIMARICLVLFLLALPVSIITDVSELGTGMILTAWFGWIASMIIRVISPEEKARSKERRLKYQQCKKEIEEQKTVEKISEKRSTRRCKESNLLLRFGIAGIIAFPFMVIIGLAKKYK